MASDDQLCRQSVMVNERFLVCYECPVSQCQEMSFITFPGAEQKAKFVPKEEPYFHKNNLKFKMK